MEDKNSNTAMSAEDRISLLESQVALLKRGLDYAVYGIGNPQPDPRDEPAATEEK